jgi:uncharacterized protein
MRSMRLSRPSLRPPVRWRALPGDMTTAATTWIGVALPTRPWSRGAGLRDRLQSGMGELSPVSSRERLAAVDVIRGWALLGVLIANLHEDLGGLRYRQPRGDSALYDAAASRFIEVAISARSITLLTFVFGLGFAIQLMRAESRGEDGAALFLRRLVVLFAIGACHILVLWWGDVASTYAVVGAALLAFRRVSDRGLLAWALALVFVPRVVMSVPAIAGAVHAALPHPASQAAFEAEFHAAVLGHDYPALAIAHLRKVLYYLAPVAAWYLPWLLGRFVLGYYAGRRRLFERDGAAHLALFRRLLVWGLVCAAAGTPVIVLARTGVLARSAVPLPVQLGLVALNELAWLGLAAAYASAIVVLMQRPGPRRWLLALAPVGQMPLTTYIGQSLVATFLFYGWGLGLSGRLGSAACLAIAVAIYALQVIACRLWLARFRFGPVEWLWRTLVYGRAQPMRRAATAPHTGG